MNLVLSFNELDLCSADSEKVDDLQRLGTEVIGLGGSVQVFFNNDGGTTPARLSTCQLLDNWMNEFRKRNVK